MQDALRVAGGHALDAGGGQWSAPSAAAAAELALWTAQSEAAYTIVRDALAVVENAEWVFYSAPLYALGATALAERARPSQRDTEAREALLSLRTRFDDQLADVLEPEPEALAFRSQLEAELRRLEGSGAPEAFEEARWALGRARIPVPRRVVRLAPRRGAARDGGADRTDLRRPARGGPPNGERARRPPAGRGGRGTRAPRAAAARLRRGRGAGWVGPRTRRHHTT